MIERFFFFFGSIDLQRGGRTITRLKSFPPRIPPDLNTERLGKTMTAHDCNRNDPQWDEREKSKGTTRHLPAPDSPGRFVKGTGVTALKRGARLFKHPKIAELGHLASFALP